MNEWSFDIWMCLGRWIDPEDISRFASICVHSKNVVSHPSFWKRLYWRFRVGSEHPNFQQIPEQLEANIRSNLDGLRTNVIRYLYFVYEPFIKKPTKDLTSLINHICVRQYYVQSDRNVPGSREKKCQYVFVFRLKSPSTTSQPQIDKVVDHFEDLLKLDDRGDLYRNPYDGHQILLVNSRSFSVLSSRTLGKKVVDFKMSISGERFRYHKLNIRLVDPHLDTKNYSVTEDIIIDSVVSYKVLEWYRPLFAQAISNISMS